MAWQTGMKSSRRFFGESWSWSQYSVMAPLDQLHHEIGPAGAGGSSIEDPGNARMFHDRQGLPLGLEAGDHLLVSMPGLMTLSATLRRTGFLLGQEDDAHASFTDPL